MNPLGLVLKAREPQGKITPEERARAASWRKSVMYGKGEPLSEREKLADWQAMWYEASGWTPEMMYEAAIRDPVHGVLPYGGWNDPRLQQAYMATSLAPLSTTMVKPPRRIGGVIERFNGLKPSQAKVEKEFGEWILKDPERAIKAALEKNGNVVNVDEYRKLWPAYEGNRSEFSVAVHEPASYLSKLVYRRLLEQPTPAGKDPMVVFTAGGTGAGKSSAVSRIPEMKTLAGRAEVVMDSNLQNFGSAVKKIDQALESGRGVSIVYIAREPVDAMVNGAIKRSMNPNSGDFGRVTPVDVFAQAHAGSHKTVGELMEKYAGDPRVRFHTIDNTGPQPRVVTYGEIPRGWYDRIDERLNDAISSEVAAGRVPQTVADAFRPGGVRAVTGGGGPREPPVHPGSPQGLGDFKVTKGGVYVGAPPGVKSPADIDRLASEYADRATRAMEAGVQPGWFYERGSKAIRELASDPAVAGRLADVNAVTSSEAPVRSNFGWAVQGLEQHAAGLPIVTGKYPKEAGSTIRKILEGVDPHLGEKRHLYGAGLKGEGGLAPNDRWEIRSMGYNADSAGPAQHLFMHRVREIAIEKLAKRTGKRLTPHEIQELNWATTRADQIGISIQKSATDTIQDAIPYYTFQHSWESVPGSTSKHLEQLAKLGPGAWAEYHEKVKSVVLTPEGRDRLISALGGDLQRPAFDVPGVYKGQVSPGTQSRSLVYKTDAGGLSPASQARVEATEAARALILGQDAYAGHIPSKSPSVAQADTAVLSIGRTITSEEAARLGKVLDSTFGPGNTAIVPTEKGVNVLSLGAENFGKTINANEKAIGALLGGKMEASLAKRAGIYGELPWAEGGATAAALEKINVAPGLRQAADSAPMRQLAGEMATMYTTLKKSGLVPNEGIVRVLTSWKEGGIPAVEELVRKGLAPAIVLPMIGAGLFATEGEPGD